MAMTRRKSFLALAGGPGSFFVASGCAHKATMTVACSDNPIDPICACLGVPDCHLAIINAATDPAVSALDPGPNPTVPYPNCAAQ